MVTDILELLIDAPDGAYAVDMHQNIVFWNSSAERILGKKAADVVGRPCYEVLGGVPEDDGRPVCTQDCTGINMARDGSIAPSQTFLTRASGGPTWISTSHLLVPGLRPELNTLVHLFHDVSDQVESRRFVHRLKELISEERPETAKSDTPAPSEDALSPRERDVLRLLAKGLGTREIAEELVLTPTTVRNHVQRILAKLGVHNRLEAVVVALRHSVP